MGKLFTKAMGNYLTRLMGNYLTEGMGKLLVIYSIPRRAIQRFSEVHSEGFLSSSTDI